MTERQEVAAKLREAGRELDGDNTSSIRSAFCAIDHIIGTQDTGRTFEPFFNRLADLIDPTCGDVSELAKDGFTPVPVFKCSECGCQHISSGYVRYCPDCGARVVIDDA